MGSYVHDASLSGFGKFVTMAYPVMDLGVPVHHRPLDAQRRDSPYLGHAS